MIGEFDIVGVFVPALLVLMLIAYLANIGLRTALARLGVYRFVWHRSLFDLALYVIVLGGVVGIFHLLSVRMSL